MEVLRFIIAGNVDDGKSTLTGRLLHDSGSLKADAVTAITAGDQLNLAHAADGLRTERQQGITMDVAYKYFTTAKKKFIVIDAPGHFRYTHNLVTGASGADVMVIIVDATRGITEQTRRHALVASFLGIKHVAVAVNKMDLVGYDEQVYNSICRQCAALAAKLSIDNVTYLPVSALQGDNVVAPSTHMPWYTGPTLLQYLDDTDTSINFMGAARFAVQHAIDTPGGKGYAGRLASGHLSVGMGIIIYPGTQPAFVKKILHGFNEVQHVVAGQSLTIFLDRAEAVRGDVLGYGSEMIVGTRLAVQLWWLDADIPLQRNNEYLLRMHTCEVMCTVSAIADKVDVHSFDLVPAGDTLQVNELAHVLIDTHQPLPYDHFNRIEPTGRGILIDKDTKATLAAFVVA